MSVNDLFIVRHGIAEDVHPEDPTDHARRLTEQGRRRVRAAAAGMREIGIAPEAIWTSPHVRALQTAAIVGEVLSPGLPLDIRESLSFRGGADAICAELSDYSGSVMVVGHEPILSGLVSRLCTDGWLRLHLKKSSLVHIVVARDYRGQVIGHLEAYLRPRVLCQLGHRAPTPATTTHE